MEAIRRRIRIPTYPCEIIPFVFLDLIEHRFFLCHNFKLCLPFGFSTQWAQIQLEEGVRNGYRRLKGLRCKVHDKGLARWAKVRIMALNYMVRLFLMDKNYFRMKGRTCVQAPQLEFLFLHSAFFWHSHCAFSFPVAFFAL